MVARTRLMLQTHTQNI